MLFIYPLVLAEELNKLAAGSVYTSFTNQTIALTLSIAAFLVPIFFALNLGWNFMSNGFKWTVGKGDSIVDYQDIGRMLTLWLFLVLYYPATAAVMGLINAVNERMIATEATQEVMGQISSMYNVQTYEAFEDPAMNPNAILAAIADEDTDEATKMKLIKVMEDDNRYTKQVEAVLSETPDELEQTYSDLTSGKFALDEAANQGLYYELTDGWNKRTKTFMKLPTTKEKVAAVSGAAATWMKEKLTFHGPAEAFITYCIKIYGVLARFVIGYMAIMLVKILLIIGPLSIAFSMLPMFKDKIADWFQTLVGCALTIGTIGLLDYMKYEVQSGIVMTESYTSNPHAAIGIDLACSILYTMAFWLTAKFAGSKDGGKFISKGVGMTTAGVTVAAGAALLAVTGGASAAAGGGKLASAASKILEAGKDAMKGANDSIGAK